MPFRARVTQPRIRPTTLLISAMGTTVAPGRVLYEVRRELGVIASEMAQELRDAIYTGKFPSPALNAKYLRQKIRRGLDPRKLIATKKYVKSIRYRPTAYGGQIGVAKGNHVDRYVRKDGQVRYKRIPYWVLQRTHEYGLGNVPARPVWRPQMREWKRRRRELGIRLKHVMGRELRDMIRRVGMAR